MSERQRYTCTQRETIENWIKTRNRWKRSQKIGTCVLVCNGSCICSTQEMKRQNKNKKNHACICKQQSTSYKNPIKNKKPKRLRVHQSVFIVKDGWIPLWKRTRGISSSFRIQMSHICGRSLCKNKDHIKDELQSKNLSRIKCHKEMIKNHLSSIPDCEHEPKCLYCHMAAWSVM